MRGMGFEELKKVLSIEHIPDRSNGRQLLAASTPL